MEKTSFFKLSMIGSTIYLFLSLLLIILYRSCQPDIGFSQELRSEERRVGKEC